MQPTELNQKNKMEDQLTTWIAAGVSFVTGWVLDNGIPRKIAKFLVSLIVKKKD